MTYTPEDIWYAMWPLVPGREASESDIKLVTDHANSLNLYLETHDSD